MADANTTELALRSFRRAHVGRLLAELHRDFSERVRELLADAGHPGVMAGHIQVFTSLPLEGARLSSLAARAGITAQSMGARVSELESLGYLERTPDPADGRATRIRFSAKGRRFLASARTAIETIDRHYAEKIGKARYEAVKSSLGLLVSALAIEIPA